MLKHAVKELGVASAMRVIELPAIHTPSVPLWTDAGSEGFDKKGSVVLDRFFQLVGVYTPEIPVGHSKGGLIRPCLVQVEEPISFRDFKSKMEIATFRTDSETGLKVDFANPRILSELLKDPNRSLVKILSEKGLVLLQRSFSDTGFQIMIIRDFCEEITLTGRYRIPPHAVFLGVILD